MYDDLQMRCKWDFQNILWSLQYDKIANNDQDRKRSDRLTMTVQAWGGGGKKIVENVVVCGQRD